MSLTGRIFCAPEAYQPPEGTLLYINIALNTWKGNQAFPQWIPAMEPAISKSDYDKLMAKLTELFETDPPGCIDCLTCSGKEKNVKAAVAKMVIEAPGWSSPARVEWEGYHAVGVGNGEDASSNPVDFGFDEHGHKCDVPAGDWPMPVWPPMGGNIVFSVPNPQLFDAWPRIMDGVAVAVVPLWPILKISGKPCPQVRSSSNQP